VVSHSVNVGPEKEGPSLLGLCCVAKYPRATLPTPVALTRCVLSAAAGLPSLDTLISLIGRGKKVSPSPPSHHAAFRTFLIAGAHLRIFRRVYLLSVTQDNVGLSLVNTRCHFLQATPTSTYNGSSEVTDFLQRESLLP
jgi:hypothetical protein